MVIKMGADWKSLHPAGRKNRPGLDDIMAYLPESVGELFREYSRHLVREYDVGCKPPTYSDSDGWVFSFGRYSVSLLSRVTMRDGAFCVQGVEVRDAQSYSEALALAATLYSGYKARLERATASAKEKQKRNTQSRVAREKRELEAMAAAVDPERFNKYRWSAKLSRAQLKALYKSDAQGLPDEALADEIGFALYARCLQGRDEELLKSRGQIKCHGCGEIVQAKSMGGLMQCECGRQYIFRDYMRAFRANNMPSGAASAIFNAFIESWPRARGYAEKMRLIDNLIHEFHANLQSGVKGRFVGINLIEGTKKQIEQLILELAYGDGASAKAFKANLKND